MSRDNPVTIEEMREAILLMRGERKTADSPTKKSKAPPRSADTMLAALGIDLK